MIHFFKRTYPFLLFFLLTSCETEDCIVTENYLNGSVKIKKCIVKTKENYFCYESYYKNTALKSTYCLKYGQYEGKVINYYPSGVVR